MTDCKDMAAPKPPAEPPPLVVDASTLFQGRKQIWIDFEGTRYRLRITRRGKLILQK